MKKSPKTRFPSTLAFLIPIILLVIVVGATFALKRQEQVLGTDSTEIVWSVLENESERYVLYYPEGSQVSSLPERVDIVLPEGIGTVRVVSDQGKVSLFPKYSSSNEQLKKRVDALVAQMESKIEYIEETLEDTEDLNARFVDIEK